MNNPTIENILTILNSSGLIWRRVRDLICVHTFYKDFYINLCSYLQDQTPAISVTVDNCLTNQNDIIDVYFLKGSKEYEMLDKVYHRAIMTSIKIGPVHQSNQLQTSIIDSI